MTSTANQPTISLLTDFGVNDVFVGVMKGVIAGICPQARVIDITHGVTPFDVLEAALLLRDAYHYFPPGSIHVAVVDPGVGGQRRIIAAAARGHIFLAPDNGILWPILAGDNNARVVTVSNHRYFLPQVSNTFHGRDIFAPVAAHLALGVPLNLLGPAVRDMHRLRVPEAQVRPNGTVSGEVLRFDRFGNLITNIPEGLLPGKGEKDIYVRVGRRVIRGIARSYESVKPGELLAIVGSTGMLEIARNQGNARELLRARRGMSVRVGR